MFEVNHCSLQFEVEGTQEKSTSRMKSVLLGIGSFLFLLTLSLAQITSIENPADRQRLPESSGCASIAPSSQKFRKCWSHTDCSPKECCAGLAHKTPGTCLHQPQVKELCSPHITPGSMKCPCRIGLTCSKRKGTVGCGRCVYITPDPDEIDDEQLLSGANDGPGSNQ